MLAALSSFEIGLTLVLNIFETVKGKTTMLTRFGPNLAE